MKQLGLLMIAGIALMSIISSAGAQSTSEPTATPEPEDCLSLTKISPMDISISWNRACYDSPNSYLIELNVTDTDGSFTKSVSCSGDSLCENSIQQLGWTSKVRPCYEVTISVIGNDVRKSLDTNLAPNFQDNDWKLDNSTCTESSLDARWGPPEDPGNPFVSCATKAMVTATCTGHNGDNSKLVEGLNTTIQGNATLDISDCTDAVTLTVTYMAGNMPTETEDSLILDCIPKTETTPPAETTNPSEVSSTTQSSGLTDGQIVGISFGSIAGVALIGVIIWRITVCHRDKTFIFE